MKLQTDSFKDTQIPLKVPSLPILPQWFQISPFRALFEWTVQPLTLSRGFEAPPAPPHFPLSPGTLRITLEITQLPSPSRKIQGPPLEVSNLFCIFQIGLTNHSSPPFQGLILTSVSEGKWRFQVPPSSPTSHLPYQQILRKHQISQDPLLPSLA